MSGQNTKLKDYIKQEVEKRIANRKAGETTLGKGLPKDPKETTPATTTTAARQDVSRGSAAIAARPPRNPSNEITTWPEKFVTGATVYFSGRNVPITINVTSVTGVEVEYDDERITVRVPIANAYQGRDDAIKGALARFYVDHLTAAIAPLVRRHADQLGMLPPETAIEHLDGALGQFGEHGEIVFNASLAYAPKFVLEYIVLHELAFRRIRNKEREFWRVIEAIMPDYRLRAEWLRQHADILRQGLPAATESAAETRADRATLPQI